jgi:hypothetical protein
MSFDPILALQLTTQALRTIPRAALRIGPEVSDSEDLRRILSLPRRTIPVANPIAAEMWTSKLRRERSEPCDCLARWGFCITKLNAVQGWALQEASEVGGLVASIGVGEGKTGIDILLAMAVPGIRSAAVLVPPTLRAQLLLRDLPQWSAHFQIPNLAGGRDFVPGRPVLHVLSYNEVSLPKNSDLFSRIPDLDLLIADECHALSDLESARTKRFLRAFQHRSTPLKLGVQSGTLTRRGLKDFAHLTALSLRENSPLPLSRPVVDEWGKAIDSGDWQNPVPAPPGALLALCGEPEAKIEDDLERVRAGFQRRLAETPGVVVTRNADLPGCSVEIEERKLKLPLYLAEMIARVQDTSERPDGEELIEKIEVHQVCDQLASGFFYRYRYPHGESAELIDRWFAARKAWRKLVRQELQRRSSEGYDSPALVMRAAIRWIHGYTFEGHKIASKTVSGPLPVVDAPEWSKWSEIHKQVRPVRDAVWIDEFALRDSLDWARAKPGIVWVDHVEFAGRLGVVARREKVDLPIYLGGEQSSIDIVAEKGSRSIVASILAHGEGKNLQRAFWRNLVAHPPGSGKTWEQLIGRTHRQGQPSDVVSVEVYRYAATMRGAWSKALNEARYIQQTGGSAQRLCFATIGFEALDE